MNALNFLDANVWLALVWNRHLHSERARAWFEQADEEFSSRSRLSSRSPKVWADAYLLAFAAVAGLKLVTFGRALQMRCADVLVL